MTTRSMSQISDVEASAGESFQALVIVDRGGIIRYWNEGASRLTGHRPDVVVGQSLDVIVPAQYREKHWNGFHAAMGSGVSKFEGLSANIPFLQADGEVRRCPGRFTLIRDARGQPAGAAAAFVAPSESDST